ncbi:MAG: PQQ-binding-like beta-propeller repeat protein [Alphaproteobacteria bacterium]|nr:PQQ-binding-like beta-propeller repeat protein [Alphaproteobacteria bacterium]
MVLASALLFAAALAADPAVGFRHGGSAVFAEATLPDRWDPADCWDVATPGWSNSSPVVVGDLVCTLSEPTTLSCHDRATGRLRWQATNDHVDTLAGEERAAWVARLAAAPARVEQAQALQRAYSEARREARRAPEDPAIAARLEELGASLAQARAAVDDDRAYLTPPDREVIGYTTHSPVSDGERIYVQLGHGVVSAFALDGTRVWSVWLGPAPEAMRGYHTGSAASPLLVEGRLVVGHRRLVALDPATGAVQWEGPPFTDFGTPAAGRVGDLAFVATPAGEVVDLSDGTVLAKGLDAPWYVGPQVDGDVITWVGGTNQHQSTATAPAHASAHRVVVDRARRVSVQPLWRTDIQSTDPFFVSPVAWQGSLYSIDASAQVWRIDARDGAVVAFAKAPVGPAYSSPVVVGGQLLLGGEDGAVAVMDPETGAVLARHVLPMTRATAVPVGGRVYVRALERLLCVGTR